MTHRERDDLLGLSDWAWERTWDRLQGLTDDEYLWEPVPECWSVRPAAGGSWRRDETDPAPAPAPITTIAWRIDHVAVDNYGASRNAPWMGVTPQGDEEAAAAAAGAAATAADALARLERAHGYWRAHLTAMDDALLRDPIGPVGGPYGDGSRASFVLHVLDDVIHHEAEIALLRDLYRATAAGPLSPHRAG